MRLGRGHSCMPAEGQLVIRLTDPHTGWQVKWDINEISSPRSLRHEGGGEADLNERKRVIWLPKNILLFWAKGTKYKYRRIQCGSRTSSFIYLHVCCEKCKSQKHVLILAPESDQFLKHVCWMEDDPHRVHADVGVWVLSCARYTSAKSWINTLTTES